MQHLRPFYRNEQAARKLLLLMIKEHSHKVIHRGYSVGDPPFDDLFGKLLDLQAVRKWLPSDLPLTSLGR